MPLTPEELGLLEKHVEHYFNKRLQKIDITLKQLQRKLLRRWLIVVVGLLITAAAVYWVDHLVISNQHHNSVALCALRHDVYDRIVATNQFLQQHPRGTPGIPRAALEVGLTDAQHTYHALRSLQCPPPVVRP